MRFRRTLAAVRNNFVRQLLQINRDFPGSWTRSREGSAPLDADEVRVEDGAH
jgi:hypothetical protein